MTLLTPIIVPPLFLEDDDLGRTALLDHGGADRGAGKQRRAGRDFCSFADHQHLGELYRRTGLGREFLDRDDIVFGDLVLFAAGSDHCEHDTRRYGLPHARHNGRKGAQTPRMGRPVREPRTIGSCVTLSTAAALTSQSPLFTLMRSENHRRAADRGPAPRGTCGSMDTGIIRTTEHEALQFHASGRPGKLSITPTKPLTTQRDLALAYSPGVAFPCLHIERQPSAAYDFTSKGNFVAVISNGTAVLGLGDLGALAAKPVMEGKAALFKRFADIDSIDLEIDTRDVDEFVNCVRFLHPAFGGINLEDIKAPECFVIEERLRELLDIPVFHDDQHGTAIIAAAGLINALHLTGRTLDRVKMVVNGAGAASIACVELLKTMGLLQHNVVLCDTRGVIYRGRTERMNQWKSAHAIETSARSLADAIEGADVFFGLSAKGAVDQAMVRSMADKPIIFAMANPDPEITPEEVRAVRGDAIIATGRSDYPNQVNNVHGFPYIFRGALDVHASTINDAMKIAAAEALAGLAREDVPDEVAAAYAGERLTYGPDYIIPNAFDPG